MADIGKRNYQNGKIYCIRNSITPDIYIGSTTQPLSKRMETHRSKCKKYEGGCVLFKQMRELGLDNFYIELLEEFPCDNVEQLRKREGELTREHKPKLNTRIECRTNQEYYIDTRDVRLQYNKEYYDKNKDKLIDNVKQYYKDNKEHKQEYIKQYREKNIDKIKAYEQDRYNKLKDQIKNQRKNYMANNKDKIKESQKQYYEHNKETILQKNKEYYQANKETKRALKREYYWQNKDKLSEAKKTIIKCECGQEVSKGAYSKHIKSQKHQQYLQEQQEN